jgi:hypothetical protein
VDIKQLKEIIDRIENGKSERKLGEIFAVLDASEYPAYSLIRVKKDHQMVSFCDSEYYDPDKEIIMVIEEREKKDIPDLGP